MALAIFHPYLTARLRKLFKPILTVQLCRMHSVLTINLPFESLGVNQTYDWLSGVSQTAQTCDFETRFKSYGTTF